LRVTVASTGAEALERLRSRKPLPDFVLMDLHASRTDGFDALREIREDPLLRELKVIVVNAADEQDHAALSRSLHATAHVKRSTGLRGFLEAVRCIEELWFAELQNEMCSNRSLMETRVCNGADLVIET
jgi:CheY-like chemotaxis protein